jgi:effector-binding domain-containing protein
MAYEVDIGAEPARPLAAVAANARMGQIGLVVRPALDKVYALFGGFSREKMGQNVIFYPDGGGLMKPEGATIYCGVEIKIPFEEKDGVVHAQTPAGRTAHAVHWGSYDGLGGAHGAIHAFAAANGHKITGVNWEVYGDMVEDMSKVRTDVYYQLA